MAPAAKNYAVPIVCGLLVAAVALVFGRTVQHGFVGFDDNEYVYQNLDVSGGLTLRGFAWAFTDIYRSHWHPLTSNWHPLTWLSHMLDCCLFGLWPGGHHLTSVLLHAATVVLLFLVLRRMTGRLWPSAMAAALFAIHPLRVESVAWIAERKDVLSGLFFMLTLWAYAGYATRPFSWVRYLAVVGLFALGLMAKPMLVTLPPLLLLLDYWPLGRLGAGGAVGDDAAKPQAARRAAFDAPEPQAALPRRRRVLIEKIPLFLLAAASCAVTIVAQADALVSSERLTLGVRLGNAVISYVAYLGQLFYPARLVVLYPISEIGFPAWQIAAALAVLAAITTVVLLGAKQRPYLPVGWFWYVGTLVPVIGVVQVGGQAMADRYTYLTQIGLDILLAWAAAELAVSRRRPCLACGIAAAAVVAALTGAAWRQTAYWRDSETLWNRTLEVIPRNSVAHNNLGIALCQQGQVEEGLKHYYKALEINPRYLQAHNNLGEVLRRIGRLDEAIAHCTCALEIQPDFAPAHSNLGYALLQKGRIAEAAEHCSKAIELKPRYADAHNNLALAVGMLGRTDEEIRHYQIALAIDPNYSLARTNLGITYYQQGNVREAVTQWRQVIRQDPGNVMLLNHLAWVLATDPDSSVRGGPEAVELAERAVQLTGQRDPNILNTLAAAYAEAGRFPEAVRSAERAMALASAQGNHAMADIIRARAELYRSGAPLHQARPPVTVGPPQ